MIDERAVMAALAQLEAQMASLKNAAEEPRDLPLETPPAFIPPGFMAPFAGAIAKIPGGWLLCDGTSYTGTDYPGLFAAIGTTHGGSAGAFNVPDCGQRQVSGYKAGDTDYGTLGTKAGADSHSGHAVGVADHDTHDHNIPQHQHGIQVHTHTLTTSTNTFAGDPYGPAAIDSVVVNDGGYPNTDYQSVGSTGDESATLTHDVSESAADHRDKYIVAAWVIKT